jgi:alginate O-acetyltransferase complex protein AlgJ
MKNFNLTRILDRLFVILVLIMLVIPLAKFNLSERSVEENRMLKKWPVWSDFHVLKGDNYFKAFENWFNDRFNQRDRLTRYAFNLDARINNTHENDHALMGKENWIFTKERNSIGNFQNTSALTPNEKETLSVAFASINNWCQNHNIRLYVYIAPDKNQIYGEFYPDKIKKVGTENQEDQIMACLRGLNIPVIYPKEDLLAHKDKGLLYYKNDTHWSDLGAYYGYVALVTALQKTYPNLKSVSESNIHMQNIVNKDKDLARMLNLEIPEYDTLQYTVPQIIKSTATVVEKYPNEDKARIVANPQGKYKIFFISDSFTGGMRPFLNETFARVVYSGDKHLFAPEIPFILKEKPDILVIECVGRYSNDLLLNTPVKEGM